MYKATEIKTGWAGLIGWRQNNGPLKIYDSLTDSASGMFFQAEHPLVNLLQLQRICPKDENIYTPWSSSGQYLEGSLVEHQNKYWVSLQGTEATPNENNEPGSAPLFWREFQWFSEWLKNLTEDAFIQVVQDFLEEKQMNSNGKGIIEERPIFDRPIYRKVKETNRGDLVGWRFVQMNSLGILTKLDRVSLCFSEAQQIELKLYSIASNTPLETISLNYTTPGEIQWFPLNWELPFLEDERLNGSFYVEFDESQISGYAISQEAEWLVGDSRAVEDYYFVPWGKMLQVHPYRLPERIEPNPETFQYEYSRTFGLNFQISMFCNYTPFLIRQKDTFKNAISKKVAINVLREIAYNANERINGTEAAVSRERVLYEIDGDTQGRDTGLAGKYKQALKAINFETSGLQKVCLPCIKKGVKYKAR